MLAAPDADAELTGIQAADSDAAVSCPEANVSLNGCTARDKQRLPSFITFQSKDLTKLPPEFFFHRSCGLSFFLEKNILVFRDSHTSCALLVMTISEFF